MADPRAASVPGGRKPPLSPEQQLRQERVRRRQLVADRQRARQPAEPDDQNGRKLGRGEPEHFEEYVEPKEEPEDEDDQTGGGRTSAARRRPDYGDKSEQAPDQRATPEAEVGQPEQTPAEAPESTGGGGLPQSDEVQRDQIRARVFREGLQAERVKAAQAAASEEVQAGAAQGARQAAGSVAGQAVKQAVRAAVRAITQFLIQALIFLFTTPVGWIILGAIGIIIMIGLLMLWLVTTQAAACDAALEGSVFANFKAWLASLITHIKCPQWQ